MLLLINSKNIGIVRYLIFLIFFRKSNIPNTNRFDTTCTFMGCEVVLEVHFTMNVLWQRPCIFSVKLAWILSFQRNPNEENKIKLYKQKKFLKIIQSTLPSPAQSTLSFFLICNWSLLAITCDMERPVNLILYTIIPLIFQQIWYFVIIALRKQHLVETTFWPQEIIPGVYFPLSFCQF